MRLRTTSRGELLPVFNFQNGTIFLSREQVQKPIRTLPHVPNALLQFHQHRFAPQFLPMFVEHDPLHLPRARNAALPESTDEEIALPVRKVVARVKRHAGHPNGWQPDDERILHT